MKEVETDIWDEMDYDVEITDCEDTSIQTEHALADSMPELSEEEMEAVKELKFNYKSPCKSWAMRRARKVIAKNWR